MVDVTLVQTKINNGYAKAAAVLGSAYLLYRAAGPNNPLATEIGSLNAWLTTDPALKGQAPMAFGKPQWFAAMQRDVLMVGDYLIGPAGTFFVSSLDDPAPVGLIYCNKIISADRLLDALPLGASAARFGTSLQNRQSFMMGWPACVLQLGGGEKMTETGMGLPSDAKLPSMTILLPACAPQMRFNDLLTDEDGQAMMITSAEITKLGWRITGELQPAG